MVRQGTTTTTRSWEVLDRRVAQASWNATCRVRTRRRTKFLYRESRMTTRFQRRRGDWTCRLSNLLPDRLSYSRSIARAGVSAEWRRPAPPRVPGRRPARLVRYLAPQAAAVAPIPGEAPVLPATGWAVAAVFFSCRWTLCRKCPHTSRIHRRASRAQGARLRPAVHFAPCVFCASSGRRRRFMASWSLSLPRRVAGHCTFHAARLEIDSAHRALPQEMVRVA
mmetsp:Transcript_109400/g.308692  ORF Transcript_109400/g.308692 Transcript_109400/m.308692 type:complete len:223 (-) Transcript_109400:123-791(-)